jgi:hypothetical protein
MKSETWARSFQIATLSVLVLGAILRIYLWLHGRSIFIDEANLIRNFVEKSYTQLWGNLDYQQYAPPLFSSASKAIIGIFGNTEQTVRLIPLLSGIGLLFFFYRIGQVFLSPILLLFASSILASNRLGLQYATECKQYASDSLITLAFILLAMHTMKRPFTWRSSIVWALLGGTAIWATMPIVFTLAGIGIALAYQAWRKKESLSPICTVIGVWIASFGLYFFTILKSDAQSDYLRNYHSKYFFALSPAHFDLKLAGNQIIDLCALPFGHTTLGVGITIAALILGMFALWQRDKAHFLLVTLPLWATLAASAGQYYSLYARLLFFLLPIMLLIISIGLQRLVQTQNKALRIGTYAVCLALVGIVARPIYNHQPFESDYAELRTGIAYIAQRKQTSDHVLFNYNTVPVSRYYLEHCDRRFKFDQVVLQPYRCCDPDMIEQDIKQLKDKGVQRIWTLHDKPDLAKIEANARKYDLKMSVESRFHHGIVVLYQ